MSSTNSHADRTLALPVLANLHIAEPCPLAEDAWQPGQRTRHCAECDLDVHNFSALTAVEAAAMVNHSHQTGTRLCASFQKDAAGNIITLDSPASLHPSAQSNRPRVLMRVLAALGLISTPIAFAACATRTGEARANEVCRTHTDNVTPLHTNRPSNPGVTSKLVGVFGTELQLGGGSQQ